MTNAREAMEDLLKRSQGEPLLDEWTLRLIQQVYKRARQGLTVAELIGYVAYRKRGATREDKEKARRVIKALKTDRWGLATSVSHLQGAAEVERVSQSRSVEAREVWYMQQAGVNALIHKRGGSKNGRSRKDQQEKKPAPRWTIA